VQDFADRLLAEGTDPSTLRNTVMPLRVIAKWHEARGDIAVNPTRGHDAGDKVVTVVRQRGQSKTSGLPVDMAFGQVWTIRDGKSTRMEMYADPVEALEAMGLSEPSD
jgi:ketosteroid isomerase-like protein